MQFLNLFCGCCCEFSWDRREYIYICRILFAKSSDVSIFELNILLLLCSYFVFSFSITNVGAGPSFQLSWSTPGSGYSGSRYTPSIFNYTVEMSFDFFESSSVFFHTSANQISVVLPTTTFGPVLSFRMRSHNCVGLSLFSYLNASLSASSAPS